MYVALTILISLGAFNSQNNLLFAAMGLAIGALIISGVLSGSALMSLSIRRLRPDPASAGAPMALRYAVENRGRLFPVLSLHIHELAGERGSLEPAGFVAVVPTRRSVQGESAMIPARRGRLVFRGVRAWSTAPFGLARKSISVMDPVEIVVRPPVLEPRAEVVAWFAARELDDSDHAALGPGEEFFGLREFRAGDALRTVAWRPSARAERILVRQHARPRSTRVWVVLDGRDADEITRERAAALAGSIIHAAARSGAAFGFSCPEFGVWAPLRSGPAAAGEILDAIARLDWSEPAPLRPDTLDRGAVVPRDAGVILVHASDSPPTGRDPGSRRVAARDLERYLHVDRLHPLAARELGIGGDA